MAGRQSLQLLGELVATAFAEEGVRQLSRGKPVALLAFLAAAPGRRASRERLSSLLWSEGTSEQARQNLRQTLWYIRRRLGTWLVATDDFVELDADVTADRDQFLVAVRERRLADAVALYAGEFIPDFAAPGAAEFEQWCELERRRLRGLFVGCCDTLARQALSGGQFATAVDVARRARDAAPDDLATWRLLLESLAASRDPLACLAEAEHLEAKLAADDLVADDATRGALRTARAVAQGRTPKGGGAATVDGSATSVAAAKAGPDGFDHGTLAPELIGREPDFRQLLARWEDAQAGKGGAVVVSGVAGLGKSRLVADFHARLRASRARTVFVRANPGDRAVRGGFIAALAEFIAQRPGAAAVSSESAAVLVALAPALASQYPSARPDASTGDDARRRRVGALLDLLRAVSDETALALCLDDAHWIDAESRRILEAVIARLEGGRVLVVVTARPPVEALGGLSALARIELAAFDVGRTAEFLARLGELPAEPWAADLPAQLHGASRGIPLNLIELLQRLLESRALALTDHVWTAPEPQRIAEVLRDGMVLESRIRSLGDGAREVLLLLAVLGRPVAAARIGAVLQVPGDRASPGPAAAGEEVEEDPRVLEVEHRGMLTRRDGQLAVAHDEIAEAAVASASGDDVRLAHARAARLLAISDSSDARLDLAAQHARQAGDRAQLDEIVRSWIARQRSAGSGASAAALIDDLLGLEVPFAERARAVGAVPWLQRPARSSRVVTALALTLTVLIGGWTAFRTPPEPDLEFLLRGEGRDARYYRVVVPRLDDWQGGEPLTAEEVAPTALPVDPARVARAVFTDRLADGAWVGTGVIADSGGDEILEVDPRGRVRQLAYYAGDDFSPSPSPDGTLIAFATARWHRDTDRSNIGILDRRSGEVRRLLPSVEYDNIPRWSPDGSRIAFLRRHFTMIKPTTVCVVAMDGVGERCDWPGLATVLNLLGWMDDEHVLLVERDGQPLRRLNVLTGELQTLGDGADAAYLPDSRVVTIRSRSSDGGIGGLALRRTDGLAAPRPILVRGQALQGAVVAARAVARPRPLHRLRLNAPEAGVPVDLTYVLRSDGFDTDSQPRRAYALRYRSLDPDIARVEGDRLLPRAVGTVRVEVTAGGYRTDTAAIAIVASTAQDVVDETWGAGWDARWLGFGEPLPRVVKHRGRRGVNPNGDGKYNSGLLFRRGLETARGLGVEIELSTPLDRLQWQEIGLSILTTGVEAISRDAALRGAIGPNLGDTFCGVAVGQEGADNRLTFPLFRRGGEELRLPFDQRLYDGRWYRLRVQAFADGRCGVAINGVAIGVTPEPARLTPSASLVLLGHSVGTTISVARARVWTGVKGGVDWSAVER